jgi:hypothetical protein
VCCAADGDSLSCSAASGSPASSSPEFSPESASDAPESGVTRTGYPEAVTRKRMLLRSGNALTERHTLNLVAILLVHLADVVMCDVTGCENRDPRPV